MKFVAIDFETANGCDQSICAAGVAVFNHGHLADSFYSLIRPPKGYGFFRPDWITGCHGIRHTDVYNAPEFPAIAPEIFARLAAADVVIAHNAQFDMRKLCGTAKHFSLPCPAFDYLCTYLLAARIWPRLKNHKLPTVAARIGYEFRHHNALADAEAAGFILLAMMNETHVAGPRALAEAVGVRPVSIAIDCPPD